MNDLFDPVFGMKLGEPPKLRRYQERAVEDVNASAAASKLLVMPTGCHAAGTGIMMADGSVRPVESIRVGDEVMGPDSHPRMVSALHSGIDEMFEVAPNKGDPFVVNGDHLLSVEVCGGVRLRNGASKHEVVSVREWLGASEWYRHTRKLWRTGVDFHSPRPLPVPPYILGILLGDGCLSHGSVQIANPDPEVAAAFRDYARSVGASTSRVSEIRVGACPIWGLSFGPGNPVIRALRSLDLFPSSSGTKFVPERYKTASRESRLEILAGLIDTDGYLCGGGFDFISKSRALSEDVAYLARSLGLAAYVTGAKKSWQSGAGWYWRVSISGETSQVPVRVPRKKAPGRRQKKSVLVSGFSVRSVGPGMFFGFECGGDHLYLMGDFTVTHNSGKTITACELIRRRGSARALFLAPRRELVFQSHAKLQEIGMPAGILMAGVEMDTSLQVQVGCVPTVHKRLRAGLNPPPADLIVIDEAHASFSSMTREILDRYPMVERVGMTATPARSDGRGLGELYDDLIEGPSVASLTAAGYLVPVRYFAPSAAELAGVRTVAGDYVAKDLSERMNQPKLVGDIVENWMNICPDRKTVVFCVDRAHAAAVHAEFESVGVASAYLDGKTPNDERALILRRLRDGKLRVVVSVDVLSYGWDEPSVSCAIIARPTKSIARYLQSGGRVLRPFEGKEDAILIDHSGVVSSLGFLDDPQPWDLDPNGKIQEREKKEKTDGESNPEEMVTQLECPACKAVCKPQPKCPECGVDLGGQKKRAIEAFEAQLQEVRAREEERAKRNEKLGEGDPWAFYEELRGFAAMRGFKAGWAYRQFEAQFGEPPPPVMATDAGSRKPSPEVESWCKHRIIKWARGKQRGAA